MTLLEIKRLWQEAVDAHYTDFMRRLEDYYDAWCALGNPHSNWRYETMKATAVHMKEWTAEEWAEYPVCEATRSLTKIAIKRARVYIVARDEGVGKSVYYALTYDMEDTDEEDE